MRDWEVGTIVLGYDASESAMRAAEIAASVARSRKAQIIVVNAAKGRGQISALSLMKDGRDIEAAHSACVAMVSDLNAQGIKADYSVLESAAAEAILSEAAARAADLIVVGTRGLELLGSVSSYVVRNARVPVLVVRKQD